MNIYKNIFIIILFVKEILFFQINDNYLFGQNAVKISTDLESYIDPEIYSDKNYLAFQTGNGDIWLSSLDPVTGLFESKSGMDILIDTGAVQLLQSFNGPEFGYYKTGWGIFYSKKNGFTPQAWKADVDGNKVSAAPLTSGNTARLSILASKNDEASSIKLLYSKGTTLETGYFAWTDIISPDQETVIDSTDRGVRWIDGSQKFFYIKQTGDKAGQIFLYDTESKSEKQITNDTLNKTYSYGWFAPEYDNDLVLLVMLDNDTKIGVYKNTGKDYWEIIKEIQIPDSSKYNYFGSPEAFVAAGKSYISCVIKQNVNSYSNSEVWLFNIQDGKNSTYQKRINDDLGEVIRSDPESYIAQNEVFIYYNVIINNKFDIYRASTGIITLKDKDISTKIIRPSQTDTNIDGHNEPHYVLLDRSSEKINKLLLFFPGTNARPYDYLKFAQTAAEKGYHVINLSYENNESINIDICPQTKDTTCHHRARFEIWFGEDRHESINISQPNSVIYRLPKLLIYLAENYPEENWGQFLDNNEINWEKIVTAGHSQGGGHAGFGSKYFKVDKVIMIAATDWVNGQTADWIRMKGPTESSKYFGFIHTLDIPIYNTIGITWRDYGMLNYGLPVNTDTEPYPYNNSHSLTTSLPLDPETIGHNFPIVDFQTPTKVDFSEYVYSDVWNYLLENTNVTDLENEVSEIPTTFELFQNYPNPFNPSTTIQYSIPPGAETSYLTSLRVYDILGNQVATLENEHKAAGIYEVNFDASRLASGVYFYKLISETHTAIKKMIFLK